jgi:8-oxo-dGTP pyrophosphatase MutT (NUDIX family)/GNAT superfamily N-acetyltransferase
MEIIQQPLTTELKDKIYSGFKEHAIQVTGQDGIGDPIAFISRENNELIGAVVVQPFWGTLHIKYVWVKEAHRRKKIGTLLTQKACEYGSNLNYPFAFVETMSFQALGFYQKLGFTLEFTRSGYADGLAFHYLKKNFPGTSVTPKQSTVSRIGVYGVAFQEEKLLVVKQKKGPHQGKFDLPGGGIESRETIEEALRREFLEEVGMTFKIMHLLDNFTANTSAHHSDGTAYCFHQMGLIYSVDLLSASVNKSPEMEFLWISLDQLSETLVSPLLLQILTSSHCLKNKTKSSLERYDS